MAGNTSSVCTHSILVGERHLLLHTLQCCYVSRNPYDLGSEPGFALSKRDSMLQDLKDVGPCYGLQLALILG